MASYGEWGYVKRDAPLGILENMSRAAKTCYKSNLDRIVVHYINKVGLDYYVIQCHSTDMEFDVSNYIDVKYCNSIYPSTDRKHHFSLGNRTDRSIWAVYDVCLFIGSKKCMRRAPTSVNSTSTIPLTTEDFRYARMVKDRAPSLGTRLFYHLNNNDGQE